MNNILPFRSKSDPKPLTKVDVTHLPCTQWGWFFRDVDKNGDPNWRIKSTRNKVFLVRKPFLTRWEKLCTWFKSLGNRVWLVRS